MIEKRRHIIENTLKEMILEQAPSDSNTDAGATSDDTLFTPAEEKFLGKFDAYGTTHLGIIYSTSDTKQFIKVKSEYPVFSKKTSPAKSLFKSLS